MQIGFLECLIFLCNFSMENYPLFLAAQKAKSPRLTLFCLLHVFTRHEYKNTHDDKIIHLNSIFRWQQREAQPNLTEGLILLSSEKLFISPILPKPREAQPNTLAKGLVLLTRTEEENWIFKNENFLPALWRRIFKSD